MKEEQTNAKSVPPSNVSPSLSWSWDQILESKEDQVPFLLEPYIPEEGIVLLHGKSSLGKSPLIWHLGLAIASGVPIWGLPVQGPSSVLYLEVDGPGLLVRPRMKLLGHFPIGIPFHAAFLAGKVDILRPKPELVRDLQSLQMLHNPRLVIINTLRKVFRANANDSEVASAVYEAFRYYFPKSALLFVHHDRKSPRDADSLNQESEDLSGSLAWKNDAQVAIHLRKSGSIPGMLRLDHTKSQVSEIHPPLILKLEEDGTTLTLFKEEQDREVRGFLACLDPSLPAAERDQRLAAHLKCSTRTAQRRRLEWEGKNGMPNTPKIGGTTGAI